MVTNGDIEMGSPAAVKLEVINVSAQQGDPATAAKDARQRRIGLISLALQMLASLSWAIGASLAGPNSLACWLQLGAAIFWCLSNGVSFYAYWVESIEATKADARGTPIAGKGKPDA